MITEQELPLFPLNVVLFPGQPLPLHIFEPRYRVMIGQCVRDSSPFGIVLLKTGSQVGDNDITIHEVGTAAYVTHVKRYESGEMDINTLGASRFRVLSTHRHQPYLTGVIQDFPLRNLADSHVKALALQISAMMKKYLKVLATLGNVELKMDSLPEDPATLAFLTAAILQLPTNDKQQLLNTPELVELLQSERRVLHREAEILKTLIEHGPRWRDDLTPFSPN